MAATLTPAAALHLASIVLALIVGFAVLARKKGTALHKVLGRIWTVSMMGAIVSSFWIQRGGLSILHVLSIVSLVFIVWGVAAIRRGDRRRHAKSMIGVFVGSLAAAVGAFMPGRYLHALFFGS